MHVYTSIRSVKCNLMCSFKLKKDRRTVVSTTPTYNWLGLYKPWQEFAALAWYDVHNANRSSCYRVRGTWGGGQYLLPFLTDLL